MRYILASWDSEGFECLQDVTQLHPDNWAKKVLFDAIKNSSEVPQNNLGHQIEMMKLRARMNTHRTPEIYLFTTEETVEFKEVEDWMIADPQSLVEWIRKNHAKKIWSDYNPQRKSRIV